MSREIVAPEKVMLASKSADGKHEIIFNEASHRYKLDGKACCGVTTFLKGGFPTSPGLISWQKGQALEYLWNATVNLAIDISEKGKAELFKAAKAADRAVAQEAADIGSVIHEHCFLASTRKSYLDLSYQIAALPADTRHKINNGINKFEAWTKANPDECIAAEELIASPTHLYCGKFDRLARRGTKLILSDYKSSKSIYLDMFIQLGAYALAIEEWMGLKVDGLEIIRFGKEDGEFETMLIDDPKEIAIFKAQAIRCRDTFEFNKMQTDPRWDWKAK